MLRACAVFVSLIDEAGERIQINGSVEDPLIGHDPADDRGQGSGMPKVHKNRSLPALMHDQAMWVS